MLANYLLTKYAADNGTVAGFMLSAFGLGIDDVKHLNFNITNQVIDKFFTTKESIVSYYNNLMYSNNIDINNTVFVWARSTDKSGESRIPDTSAYIGILNTLNLDVI